MSKLFENLPLPPVYYHGREASYWREDDAGGWIKINETGAKNFAADFGYLKRLGKEANCEADDCLMKIQSRQNVAFVGPLAGFDAGVYTRRISVASRCPCQAATTRGSIPFSSARMMNARRKLLGVNSEKLSRSQVITRASRGLHMSKTFLPCSNRTSSRNFSTKERACGKIGMVKTFCVFWRRIVIVFCSKLKCSPRRFFNSP